MCLLRLFLLKGPSCFGHKRAAPLAFGPPVATQWQHLPPRAAHTCVQSLDGPPHQLRGFTRMLSPPSGALMHGMRLVPLHAALSASSLTALPPAFSLQLFRLRFVMLYPLALATALIHSYGSVFMNSPVRRHGSPHYRSLLELAPLSTSLYAFYSSCL